jgi:hypothetical protein
MFCRDKHYAVNDFIHCHKCFLFGGHFCPEIFEGEVDDFSACTTSEQIGNLKKL